jgi:hypothetical protein
MALTLPCPTVLTREGARRITLIIACFTLPLLSFQVNVRPFAPRSDAPGAQVALWIEGVVDGSLHRQEPLSWACD